MRAYLEPEEVTLLEQAAANLRDRLLIRLLFYLGCRISEALGITEEDIDFGNSTVSIMHLKTGLKLSCPHCGAGIGKSHTFCPKCGAKVAQAIVSQFERRRQRVVSLDSGTLTLLKEYIERDGPVVRDGKRLIFGINRHRAWQIIGDCALRAGLPKLVNPDTGRVHNVSPHRLRDAFAVHAVKVNDSGDGLRLLQQHLGHASFNTTAKYRKVSGDEEQPADDLRGVDALQIMTVHQAKGLEWPLVFIPCVTAKRFPSSRARAGQKLGWHVPEDLFDAERYAGGIEDERKLFYVAMTRNRDLCCISFHNRIRNHIGKSEFLSHIGRPATAMTERRPLPHIKINRPAEQEEIQTFSGGEIIEYLRCLYFYRPREQWNYQAGLDPALGYGKSLHHCLRVASENIKRGAEPSKAVLDVMDADFHLPYAGSTARNQMLQKAKSTLSKFAAQHVEDLMNIEEVEARLEFPVQSATITGRVDVILKGKDKPVLEVRDYKTSDEVTTFGESSLQVRLYTLGLRKMGRPVEKASVAYLDTGEVKSVDVSPQKLEEAKKIAENCIKDMMCSKYHGKGKSKCACDYHPICFYLMKT